MSTSYFYTSITTPVFSKISKFESQEQNQNLCGMDEKHNIEYTHTTKYRAGYAICDVCSKDIVVADGYYRCEVDAIDYHVECLKQI